MAFVLATGSSFFVVFAVAWVRVAGNRPRLVGEANSFAVSLAGIMAATLAEASVLTCVAFIAAKLQGRGVANALRIAPTRTSAVGFCAASAGMVGLSVACGAAKELLRVRGGGVMDAIELALRSPPAAGFAAAIATIAIAPGFAEEAFFRGLMQTRLAASWGRWPAVVFSSATFGLIHLDPVQGSAAFLAGIYLGWVTERFDGVRPSMVAHMTNNALFVAMAAFGPAGADSRLAKQAAFALGAAVWAASIWVLCTRHAKTL